ncbi:hypothetical protein BCR36DRAFT_416623 [Piromyces finnis]|uniref:Uncharacterized protein n=1 Tax=Piromyces finnis TaxID=1754191 RepID=A0A1Y1UVT5_9FUNG|nr:hypothetical protein BCR36DRAFT_416623 [Piromyces finnis]|eukprot:ORX41727.1 hypothetical protein BCR36DRAFT_416623 [Piromyces finnis]
MVSAFNNVIKNEFENQSNVVKDVNNLVNNNSIENQGLNVIGVKNKLNVRESDNLIDNKEKFNYDMKKKMQFPKKDKNISNIKRDNICDKTINKRNDSSNSIQSKIDEESSDKCDLLEESQRNKEKAFINRFNDNESDSSSIVGDDEFIDITTLSSRSRKKYTETLKNRYLELMKNPNISLLNTKSPNNSNNSNSNSNENCNIIESSDNLIKNKLKEDKNINDNIIINEIYEEKIKRVIK